MQSRSICIVFNHTGSSSPDWQERVSNTCLHPLRTAFGYKTVKIVGGSIQDEPIRNIAKAIVAGFAALTLLLPLTITGVILLHCSKSRLQPIQILPLRQPTIANPPIPQAKEEPQKTISEGVNHTLLLLNESNEASGQKLNQYLKKKRELQNFNFNEYALELAEHCQESHFAQILEHIDFQSDAVKVFTDKLFERGDSFIRQFFVILWKKKPDTILFKGIMNAITDPARFVVAWETLRSAVINNQEDLVKLVESSFDQTVEDDDKEDQSFFEALRMIIPIFFYITNRMCLDGFENDHWAPVLEQFDELKNEILIPLPINERRKVIEETLTQIQQTVRAELCEGVDRIVLEYASIPAPQNFSNLPDIEQFLRTLDELAMNKNKDIAEDSFPALIKQALKEIQDHKALKVV